MSSVMREKELKSRKSRRKKLAKLRKHYFTAKGDEEKTHLLNKVKRVAPWLSEKEFITPAK